MNFRYEITFKQYFHKYCLAVLKLYKTLTNRFKKDNLTAYFKFIDSKNIPKPQKIDFKLKFSTITTLFFL